MGTQLSLPQRGTAYQFSAHICCNQMAAWIKMSLGMELGLGPGNFVIWGARFPLPKRGPKPPKFSAHVYCGQMARWMKLLLGMVVGLSPGDFVLDGDLARPLNFGPMLIIVIVCCRTRVKRLYACAQIHYLCFSNYRIRVKYSGESRDVRY